MFLIAHTDQTKRKDFEGQLHKQTASPIDDQRTLRPFNSHQVLACTGTKV